MQFKVQRLLDPCEGNLQTHVATQTESTQKIADVGTQTAEPTCNLQSCNASCNCQKNVLENQEMIKGLLQEILKNQKTTTTNYKSDDHCYQMEPKRRNPTRNLSIDVNSGDIDCQKS